MTDTESHAERVGTDAAIHFAARYWQHGDDPEAQFALGQLSLAVHNLRERVEEGREAVERVETAEEYAEQLQNDLAEFKELYNKKFEEASMLWGRIHNARNLAQFWYDNRDWEPGDADTGPRMLQWGAAAGRVFDVVGRSDD